MLPSEKERFLSRSFAISHAYGFNTNLTLPSFFSSNIL